MDITINDYYQQLSKEEKKKFRLDVCAICGIEYGAFSRRRREDLWTTLERKAVEKYIEEKGYETDRIHE